MSDIRKANPFIEAGFELFKQIPEPNTPTGLFFPDQWYVENCYVGKWDSDYFDPGCDDCFYLDTFVPDFRLYYAIASLNYVCKGEDWTYGESLGHYFRENALGDCKLLGYHTVSLGIHTVLNGLQLVSRAALSRYQVAFINAIGGYCTKLTNGSSSEYMVDSHFRFLSLQSNLDELMTQEVIEWSRS